MSAMSRGQARPTADAMSESASRGQYGPRGDSYPEQGEDAPALSRRAQVASAMAGLQRFKQSWISVMLLKAGIGLGQVTVLLILLILSHIIPSPLNSALKQVNASDACPHPHLFQAWMGIQICRLTICWGVSVWILVRSERRRRRRRQAEREAEAEEAELAADSSALVGAGADEHGTVMASTGAVGTVGPAARVNSSARTRGESGSSEVSASRTRPLSHLETAAPTAAPSLSHSTSSTSTATLAALHQRSSSPCTPPIPAGASSSRVDLSMIMEMERLSFNPADDAHRSSVEEEKKSLEMQLDKGAGHPTTKQSSTAPVGLAARGDGQRRSVRISEECPPRMSLAEQESRLRTQRSMQSLRQARDMHFHGGSVSDGEHAADIGSRAAKWLDERALQISRGLGAASFLLFILGNILLFYPPPGSLSCYSANPLLWWGVATVTAVGWILLIQIFFVVVIVGIGGTVVLNALRRFGIIPAPPEPEPPRPAQPDPLTSEELATIKLVCYLPEKPGPLDRPHSSLSSSPQSSHDFDPSRLPHPAVFLPAHRATCAICQENFELPKEGRTILLKADSLRMLGCDHVYHVDCIDEWLLKGAGNCPFCNRPVRETPAPAPAADSGTSSSRRGWLGRRSHRVEDATLQAYA